MSTSPHNLTPAQITDLVGTLRTPEGRGEDVSVACTIEPSDHTHVVRVGRARDPLARVAIGSHSGSGVASTYLHPSEARKLAAAILNAADECDGTAPLIFAPRDVPEADLDTPRMDP